MQCCQTPLSTGGLAGLDRTLDQFCQVTLLAVDHGSAIGAILRKFGMQLLQ